MNITWRSAVKKVPLLFSLQDLMERIGLIQNVLDLHSSCRTLCARIKDG